MTAQGKPDTHLIQQNKEAYGDNFGRDLFEQYCRYVESAEKISERRISANNFLLAVNVFLVTLFGLVVSSKYKSWWAIILPITGILVSLTWHRMITSYRDLNTIKFKVIHELEKQMPAALYAYEWRIAEEGKGKAYHPLSHLERWVPVIFIILYLFLAGFGILDWAIEPGR